MLDRLHRARVIGAIDFDKLGRAQSAPPQWDLEQLLLPEHPDRGRRQRRVEHRDVEMALMVRHVDIRATRGDVLRTLCVKIYVQ